MASFLRSVASRALVRGSRGVFQSCYLSNARVLHSYHTRTCLPSTSVVRRFRDTLALRPFATDGAAVPSDGVDTPRSPVSSTSTSTVTSSSTETVAATDNVDTIVGDSTAGTGPETNQNVSTDSFPMLTPALHSIDSVHEEFVIPKERTVRSILSPFFDDVQNNPRALALLTVFITKTSGDVAVLRDLVEEGFGLWEQVYRRVTSLCTEHPQPMSMLEDLMTEDLLSACEKVFTEPSANTSVVVKGKGKTEPISSLMHVIDLAGFAVRDLKLELEFPVLRDFVLNETETRPYRYCVGPLEFSVPVPLEKRNPSEWFLLTTLWQQLVESADASARDQIEPTVCKLNIGVDIFVSEYVAKEKSPVSLSFEEIKAEHKNLSKQGFEMVTGAAWESDENTEEAKEQMAKAEKLSERMDVITEKFWGDMKGVLEQRVSGHQWTLQYDLKEAEEDRFWRICSMRNNVPSMVDTAREFLLQPSHASLWHPPESEEGDGGWGAGGRKA